VPRIAVGLTRRVSAFLAAGIVLMLDGCQWEPSQREVRNARAFEALLTAVSLKNKAELEKDAKVIDDRHAAGELSDANCAILREVIAKARSGDWRSAESRAYEFRKQFGNGGAYFR
jgi:hypothetical protein